MLQDEGVAEADYQETLKEKVRTLEAYMVDIAQTVIKDSEQSTGEGEAKAPSAFRYGETLLPPASHARLFSLSRKLLHSRQC